MNNLKSIFLSVAAATMLLAPNAALSQPSNAQSVTTEGVMVSSSANTLVVRTGEDQYTLFVLDRDTSKPRTIANGSRVTVTSLPDEDGVQVASRVNVNSGPSNTPSSTPPAAGSSSTANNREVIPPAVRRMESRIERQAKRYRAGVRAGMGLDPELVTIGVQAQIGPVFNSNVFVRPVIDFGIGEITTMVSVNLDLLYRLPVSTRRGRYSTYFGIGPAFNFLGRGINTPDDREINFDNFDYGTGMNILGGVEFRNGTFFELRSTVYTEPHLRLVVGYSF